MLKLYEILMKQSEAIEILSSMNADLMQVLAQLGALDIEELTRENRKKLDTLMEELGIN